MTNAPTGRQFGPQASASLTGRSESAGKTSCDPLTGLCDWKAFHQSLRDAALHATRTKTALSLLMIDLGQAETIAARRGRGVVDELLRLTAHRLQALTDEHACLARYNQTRFVVILPGTDLAGAQAQASRLATEFGASRLFADLLGPEAEAVMAMIGAVQFRDDESLGLCLQRAVDAVAMVPPNGPVAPASDAAGAAADAPAAATQQ